MKGHNSSNNENLSIASANGGANSAIAGAHSNKFIYAGGDYKLTKNLTVQYYYGGLEDFYKQKNAMWRNNIPGQNQQDENRVILSYTLALF